MWFDSHIPSRKGKGKKRMRKRKKKGEVKERRKGEEFIEEKQEG